MWLLDAEQKEIEEKTGQLHSLFSEHVVFVGLIVLGKPWILKV